MILVFQNKHVIDQDHWRWSQTPWKHCPNYEKSQEMDHTTKHCHLIDRGQCNSGFSRLDFKKWNVFLIRRICMSFPWEEEYGLELEQGWLQPQMRYCKPSIDLGSSIKRSEALGWLGGDISRHHISRSPHSMSLHFSRALGSLWKDPVSGTCIVDKWCWRTYEASLTSIGVSFCESFVLVILETWKHKRTPLRLKTIEQRNMKIWRRPIANAECCSKLLRKVASFDFLLIILMMCFILILIVLNWKYHQCDCDNRLSDFPWTPPNFPNCCKRHLFAMPIRCSFHCIVRVDRDLDPLLESFSESIRDIFPIPFCVRLCGLSLPWARATAANSKATVTVRSFRGSEDFCARAASIGLAFLIISIAEFWMEKTAFRLKNSY
jgi:hypothetical protein